jgi:hypothetical protein
MCLLLFAWLSTSNSSFYQYSFHSGFGFCRLFNGLGFWQLLMVLGVLAIIKGFWELERVMLPFWFFNISVSVISNTIISLIEKSADFRKAESISKFYTS